MKGGGMVFKLPIYLRALASLREEIQESENSRPAFRIDGICPLQIKCRDNKAILVQKPQGITCTDKSAASNFKALYCI